MTFLRELVTLRSLENPGKPLTDSSLLSTLGGWPSDTGVSVSPEGALRIGAALRGVQIISGGVGQLPLKAYRKRDRAEFLGANALSADEPYTPYELWSMAAGHMVTRGFAAIFKVRDDRGNVTNLIPIHPSRIGVDVVDSTSYRGWDLVFTIDGKGPFTRYEIMYVMLFTLDGIHGIGPIRYARETFNLAVANERTAAKLFGQGLMQAGYLSTDAEINDPAIAARIKKQWRERMGGLDNAHEVALLDKGAQFKALTLDPADAQFLESRRFQVTEIARLLGLPGWMLNDQEKSTSWGSGMEQQFSTFVKLTLRLYTTPLEQRITKEILPRTAYSEFLLEGLLRGDSKSRAAFYNAGITGGWLVPNDVRPKENLAPVPWGDEPYLPFNTSAEAQKELDDEDRPPREDEDDDDE